VPIASAGGIAATGAPLRDPAAGRARRAGELLAQMEKNKGAQSGAPKERQ